MKKKGRSPFSASTRLGSLLANVLMQLSQLSFLLSQADLGHYKLSDFDLQRAASLGIITMLRESDWTREGHQPEYGFFTAEKWLTHWAAHDTTHLRQIESILEAYQTRSVGE